MSAAQPPFRGRIDRAKLGVYYVVLLRWDEISQYAQSHKIPWPWEQTKEAAYNEFARVYHLEGITHLSESGHDITWFHKQVFGS